MVKIKELNLIDDKKLIAKLNIWSLGLMLFFYVVFYGIGTVIRAGDYAPLDPGSNYFTGLLTIFSLYFILIVIHELIHGLFFKLFNRDGEVIFGFKNFLAYASSPHSKYSALEYAIICLAPFVFVSLGLTATYAFTNLNLSRYVLLAAMHAAACVGDFYFFTIILKSPKGAKFEDTATGFAIYHQDQ